MDAGLLPLFLCAGLTPTAVFPTLTIVQPNRRFSTVVVAKAVCVFMVLAFSARMAWSQAPSGEFIFEFPTSSIPVIDLSGDFNTSQSIVGGGGTLTPLIYSINLTNDPSGRIHGTGVTIVQIGNDVVAAVYTARGNVTGGGLNPTRVSLTVHLTGGGPIANVETTFSISLRYNLFLDAADGILQGSVRGSANLGRLGAGIVQDDSNTVPLPGGIDGSWTADLIIIPLTGLGGTATILLPNGRVLQAIISGSFSNASGISRIKMTGIGSDRGFSITFTTTAGEEGLQLETVRGRILGQSVFE